MDGQTLLFLSLRMPNSLIKIFGGKQLQQVQLRKIMKPCSVFIEGFAGGIAHILNSEVRAKEIAVDTNYDIINLYRMLRDEPKFIEYTQHIEYSEASFNEAFSYMSVAKEPTNRLEALARAINYLVLNRMSFDAKGKNYTFSERLRGGRPENINSWENLKLRLPKLRERIFKVVFLNENFMLWILNNNYLNDVNCCLMLDPPYLHRTRTTNNDYGNDEMDDSDHIILLKLIKDANAKIIVCGYDNDLYNDILGGWNKTFDLRHVNGGTGKKNTRTEVMWYNYEL